MNLANDNANVDAMANCGLGFLNLRLYTDRNAFNNTGYSLTSGTDGRADKEHLGCVACKPGFKPDTSKTSTTDKLVRGCT